MRTIEPMGRLSSVPPAHPAMTAGSLLKQRSSDSFQDLLQDASSRYRRTGPPLAQTAQFSPKKRRDYLGVIPAQAGI